MNALFARVRHRHDDERLDQILSNQPLRRFIHAPFHSGKSGRGIENILAIVQIKHRVTSPRPAPVTGRQINQNVAPIPQNLRTKRAMCLNVPGQRMFRHRTSAYRQKNSGLVHATRETIPLAVEQVETLLTVVSTAMTESTARFLDFAYGFARIDNST